MASEVRAQPRSLVLGEVWPPDDTGESILGTDLHQGTIIDLCLGLTEAARTGLPPGRPVPWQALSQMALLGGVRPDGSLYRTYPDIFVYPRRSTRPAAPSRWRSMGRRCWSWRC